MTFGPAFFVCELLMLFIYLHQQGTNFCQLNSLALSYLVAQFILLGRRVGGAGAVLVTVAGVHVVDDGL